MIDENDVFKEVTLRVCGTLDIEKALWQCFEYLSPIFPIDIVILHYFIPEENSGVGFAEATVDGGRLVNYKGFLPPEFIETVENNKMPDAFIQNRANEEPWGKFLLETRNIKSKCSTMTARLILDSKWLGGITFIKKGWDCYKKEDLEFLKPLRVPFAIALSNSKRYLQLLEMKNILADDNRYLQSQLHAMKSGDVIGHDLGLKLVMEQIRQVAPLSSTVLLCGETGVGKEIIANTIHSLSLRKDNPHVKVNCGAIPRALMDSELFGHEKGAFTGAIEKRRGHFERANHGTLFLDEIGELSMDAQVRLLRVLQEKEFETIGGNRAVKVDVRLIAATHRDLESMIKKGKFREDLFFRLNVFPVTIPPLRERKEDIPALVHHFIEEKYREMGLTKYPVLAENAIECLKKYDWPGNVRELENTVERAIILSQGKAIRFDDICKPQRRNHHAPDITKNDIVNLDGVVSQHIMKILKRTKGKIGGSGGAAQLLGVHPATLRHRMRKLDIPFGRNVQY